MKLHTAWNSSTTAEASSARATTGKSYIAASINHGVSAAGDDSVRRNSAS
jgi:hypothetical protein